MEGVLIKLPIVGPQIYPDALALIRFAKIKLILKEHGQCLRSRVLDLGPAPSQEWASLGGRPGDYLRLMTQDQSFA